MPELLETLQAALADRYRIERMIGEGGMATVWLAQDLRHHRPLALKLLRPELAQTLGTERFGREIEVAARLNHPHVLPLLDSGTVNLGTGMSACPYYVMPFVEGETLRARLKRDGRVPEQEALRIAREVAEGLDHAHRHGVLHRDIKPENVLLSEGHAVVADFGIARAVDEAGGAALTRTGQTVGTPAYMSPEQITGERPVDGRSDLYALGCVLFEMLTGKPPGTGSSLSGMLARRLAEEAPSARSVNPGISESVDAVVQRTLARDPEERFSTPGEFASVVATLATGEQFTYRSPRRKRQAMLVGAGLVAVVALAAIALLPRRSRGEAITALAVTPLTTPAADSTAAYLSEGIQDGVVDLLRRLPQLTVTAPILVGQVIRREPELTSEELGRKLGVGAVLAWELRRGRAGDSLHLRAELVQVPGGNLLWSSRYDRTVGDVQALQGEIARTIGDSLRLALGGADVATLHRRPIVDKQAYDLYLRGYFLNNRATPPGTPNARLLNDSTRWYANRALALDSSFARGWSLLSSYFALASFRGWRAPFLVMIDSTMLYARKSLAIDSTIGNSWVSLSTAAMSLDDWPLARHALERAVKLAPESHEALRFRAIYLAEAERAFDSAIVHARQATLMEPDRSHGFNTLGDILMRARRYDSAVVALREAVRISPLSPAAHTRLITSYERLGRWTDAVAARRAAPDTGGAGAFAAALSRDGPAGYRQELGRELRRRIDSLQVALRNDEPGGDIPPLREERIALLHTQLGEAREAMDWVLRLREKRPGRFRLVVGNPDFEGLRGDPRFLPLVRQEGLESLFERHAR
ncbi:MAG: protein kinase domain-containing protein [Gemmatimonadales bacterium]